MIENSMVIGPYYPEKVEPRHWVGCELCGAEMKERHDRNVCADCRTLCLICNDWMGAQPEMTNHEGRVHISCEAGDVMGIYNEVVYGRAA